MHLQVKSHEARGNKEVCETPWLPSEAALEDVDLQPVGELAGSGSQNGKTGGGVPQGCARRIGFSAAGMGMKVSGQWEGCAAYDADGFRCFAGAAGAYRRCIAQMLTGDSPAGSSPESGPIQTSANLYCAMHCCTQSTPWPPPTRILHTEWCICSGSGSQTRRFLARFSSA